MDMVERKNALAETALHVDVEQMNEVEQIVSNEVIIIMSGRRRTIPEYAEILQAGGERVERERRGEDGMVDDTSMS